MSRLVCLIFGLTGGLDVRRVAAQTPHSLKSVPADAAFFLGLHNQLEMIRRIAASETVKMIRKVTPSTDKQEHIGNSPCRLVINEREGINVHGTDFSRLPIPQSTD